MDEQRFCARAKTRGRRDVGFDHRAARDGAEDGAGATRLGQQHAERGRGRPQGARRRTTGARGAHRAHERDGARLGPRQPAIGAARGDGVGRGRAAVSHHPRRRGRPRRRRAGAVVDPLRQRHAGHAPSARRPGSGPRAGAAHLAGGRQGEPHWQSADRPFRRLPRPHRRLRVGRGGTRPPRRDRRAGRRSQARRRRRRALCRAQRQDREADRDAGNRRGRRGRDQGRSRRGRGGRRQGRGVPATRRPRPADAGDDRRSRRVKENAADRFGRRDAAHSAHALRERSVRSKRFSPGSGTCRTIFRGSGRTSRFPSAFAEPCRRCGGFSKSSGKAMP